MMIVDNIKWGLSFLGCWGLIHILGSVLKEHKYDCTLTTFLLTVVCLVAIVTWVLCGVMMVWA